MKSSLILTLYVLIMSLVACRNTTVSKDNYRIIYPENQTVFPPDLASPTFIWEGGEGSLSWTGFISGGDSRRLISFSTSMNQWRPSKDDWESIKKEYAGGEMLSFVVTPVAGGMKPGSVHFSISADSVAAPIFYRAVPLPFKFARENLEKVSWRLGNISDYHEAPAVLENLPVCGNCHSFTPDGKQLAMDIDARDEKGAYIITDFREETTITERDIINWSDFQQGKFTYGLLSQISPDGRFVVSTLRDCEIFVDRHDMEYSQLFFPFKGILVYYDRDAKIYTELAGANDTNMVQSNPAWSPRGDYIYFARSKAVHFSESGIMNGSNASNHTIYNQFLDRFLKRERLFKFDICRIPFNNGRGGVAEPLKGASENGMSNYFPRISPDGKWIVFCQAESFMLLQKDSKLMIMPAEGGEPRLLRCNSDNMNSWHSWSPNGRWLVFSSKARGPYTQLYLTHIDDHGNDSPPVLLEYLASAERAANIPEFVNVKSQMKMAISPDFLDQKAFDLRRGQLLIKINDLNQALSKFNSLISREPENHEAIACRADLYMKLNEPQKAMSDIDQAIKLDNNNASYYLLRGLINSTTGKADEAVWDFTRNIELDPYSFEGYNNRGLVKARQGKAGEALKDYMKASGLNDQAVRTYVNIGAAYGQMKNYTEAYNYLNRAIQINPEDASPYITMGILYKDENRLAEAAGTFDKVIALDPENAEVLSMRAKIREMLGDIAGAVTDLEVAAGLDPDNAALQKQAFRLHYNNKNFRQALDHLNAYLELNPGDNELKILKTELEVMINRK